MTCSSTFKLGDGLGARIVPPCVVAGGRAFLVLKVLLRCCMDGRLGCCGKFLEGVGGGRGGEGW